MFKRKVKIYLTPEENSNLVKVLLEFRNHLLSENKYTDVINELRYASKKSLLRNKKYAHNVLK